MNRVTSDEEFEEICRAAVELWGWEAQLDMVVEECAELIKAVQKRKRGKAEPAEVIEEGVDVEIMLGQLKYIYHPNPLWPEIREKKLERLRESISEAGK